MEDKKKIEMPQDMLNKLTAEENPNDRDDGEEPPLYIMVVDAKNREHIVKVLNIDKAFQGDVEIIEEWYEEEDVESEWEPGVYQTNIRIESYKSPDTPISPGEWECNMDWYNTKKYRLELPHEEI
ncbi:hypothetical protein LCGC14_1608710 [marine sediment metagenome]|uniref:Uncharacterized protein n=1 Tax=marine sediment metagenome TaxID=412755 RepID=A0A0F9I902_9ZZZZ